jgi:hypothetical protein
MIFGNMLMIYMRKNKNHVIKRKVGDFLKTDLTKFNLTKIPDFFTKSDQVMI